jgi:hypothetical protein
MVYYIFDENKVSYKKNKKNLFHKPYDPDIFALIYAIVRSCNVGELYGWRGYTDKPWTDKPWTDKPWTRQTLDTTNPGHNKPWTRQTLDTIG